MVGDCDAVRRELWFRGCISGTASFISLLLLIRVLLVRIPFSVGQKVYRPLEATHPNHCNSSQI